jgi:peptidyl-prolyl cis-trans isomerase D
MLQRIGERVKGWFAWLIIIVIAITFTLFGASYYLGQKGASETMAVIGDSIITKGEFDTAYRRLKRQTKVLTQAIEIQLKDQAMKQLVFNHVVMEAAAKEGFVITKEQAQAAIMAIPQFLEEGKFSQERFQQTLSSNLFTPQSFLQEVKQGMLLNQQRFLFTASSFVLPTELDRFIQLATETRDYRYLTISPATMSDIKVTEDELKAYYKKHAQDFMKEEQVSIDYVELSMKALTASISISEPDLKAYFEDNKANYITPARYKLAHILILSTDKKQDEAKLKEVTLALKEGKPFADVAKRYSSDLLSLNAELPWMTVGTMGGGI